MSAHCCTGRDRHTNMLTIIHFDDGEVSEGFYIPVFNAKSPCMQSWGFRKKRYQELIKVTC